MSHGFKKNTYKLDINCDSDWFSVEIMEGEDAVWILDESNQMEVENTFKVNASLSAKSIRVDGEAMKKNSFTMEVTISTSEESVWLVLGKGDLGTLTVKSEVQSETVSGTNMVNQQKLFALVKPSM